MKPPDLLEEDVQRTVVEGLTALGYTVLVTSRQRRRCTYCHRVSHRGDGMTKGTPDLLVGRKGWGPCWLGLEMKGTKTPLSDEQKALLAAGLITVARSWEEAAAHVQAFQVKYGLPGPLFS